MPQTKNFLKNVLFVCAISAAIATTGCRASVSASAGSSNATPAQTATTTGTAASTRGPTPLSAKTPEECSACGGAWGKHGLSQTDSCNCKTNDGGKRCRDGNDCQGMCIGADEPEREVVEAGPPARGFFVGRCSPTVTVYGCNRIIDRGAVARGPVPMSEPPSSICVD
jgi:hypothetical protein